MPLLLLIFTHSFPHLGGDCILIVFLIFCRLILLFLFILYTDCPSCCCCSLIHSFPHRGRLYTGPFVIMLGIPLILLHIMLVSLVISLIHFLVWGRLYTDPFVNMVTIPLILVHIIHCPYVGPVVEYSSS